jgi:3-hydroxyisobutyrate dehydrogenase-like beta-hydroxyacid dehydrogenase
MMDMGFVGLGVMGQPMALNLARAASRFRRRFVPFGLLQAG